MDQEPLGSGMLLSASLVLIPLALIGAVAALWGVNRTLDRLRLEASIQQLLSLFGPASAAVQHDPKALLIWHPIAQGSRTLFPEAFTQLDRAFGGRFPF